MKNHSRSRSTNEEPYVKEEKRRSQSLRKNPTPLESSEQGEGVNNKLSKSMEPKSFLRKNNGTGPGSGNAVAKLKSSVASEVRNDEEEFNESAFETNVIKDDDELEFDNVKAEDQLRMSQESERPVNTEFENGNALLSDPTLVAEFPATVEESPGESPMSWNSHTPHPFTYTHDTVFEVDVSAESPIGSPASWNPVEAEGTQMRKKWGSAQKPILVANCWYSIASYSLVANSWICPREWVCISPCTVGLQTYLLFCQIGDLRSGSTRLVDLNDFVHDLYKKGPLDILSFCEAIVTPIVEGYGGWAF